MLAALQRVPDKDELSFAFALTVPDGHVWSEGNSAFSVYIFNLSHSQINYHSTGLMDSAHNHFKRARLFEDLEDEDAEVIFPSSVYPSPLPESTVPANKGYAGSAIQSLFTGSVKAEEATLTPKFPKKRGRKKKNVDPCSLSFVITTQTKSPGSNISSRRLASAASLYFAVAVSRFV
ncbi:unnamed protein product [Arabidopsis halleri]